MVIYLYYLTLAWTFKDAIHSLTHIFPGLMSWEQGWLISLMPNIFNDVMYFDIIFILSDLRFIKYSEVVNFQLNQIPYLYSKGND